MQKSNIKKKKQKPVFNPFEQVAELAKDTAVTTVKEVAKTANPLSELFSDPTQKERQDGNNNFTDLDMKKLQKHHEGSDEQDIEAIRAQLNPDQKEAQEKAKLKMQYHKRVQREEEEENLKEEQEKQEKERQEAMEEQQKVEEEAAQNAQPLEIPKGKVRKSILGGKNNRKASTELPPELKPGAGKG